MLKARFKTLDPLTRFRSLFGHCPLRVYLGSEMYVDVGRFSYLVIDKLSLVDQNGFRGCVATVGGFCEFADCEILVGGEHQLNDGVDFVFSASPPFSNMLRSVGVNTSHLPKRPLVIEDGVRVAHRAIVLSGVTLGEGSVIGAGAVIAKSVPAFEIHAGNPGKKIKSSSVDPAYHRQYCASSLSSILKTHQSKSNHLDGNYSEKKRIAIEILSSAKREQRETRQIKFLGVCVDGEQIVTPAPQSPFMKYFSQVNLPPESELEWIENPLSLPLR